MLHSFLYDHSYYIWYVIIIGLIVEIAANKLQWMQKSTISIIFSNEILVLRYIIHKGNIVAGMTCQ